MRWLCLVLPFFLLYFCCGVMHRLLWHSSFLRFSKRPPLATVSSRPHPHPAVKRTTVELMVLIILFNCSNGIHDRCTERINWLCSWSIWYVTLTEPKNEQSYAYSLIWVIWQLHMCSICPSKHTALVVDVLADLCLWQNLLFDVRELPGFGVHELGQSGSKCRNASVNCSVGDWDFCLLDSGGVSSSTIKPIALSI